MTIGDQMWIHERYAGAIASKNLKSDARTTYSDADVIAAMGLASRGAAPLGVALARLLAGDRRAELDVSRILGEGIVSYAFKSRRREIKCIEAANMARAVLGWFRDGTCKTCGGVGFKRIDGTPSLSDTPCPVCRGSGKRSMEAMFDVHDRELARWAAAEIERKHASAGPAAMKLISTSTDV